MFFFINLLANFLLKKLMYVLILFFFAILATPALGSTPIQGIFFFEKNLIDNHHLKQFLKLELIYLN